MRRHYRLYLEDMLNASESIFEYVSGLSREALFADKMRVDAVVRNFEIIGEASSKIPPEIRQKYPAVEWKRLADLRNVLIHEYFGINRNILWDITANKLPQLAAELKILILKEN